MEDPPCKGDIVGSYKDRIQYNLMLKHFRGKLVKIKYFDHVEFRKVNVEKVSPALREAVGWIAYEDSESIIVVFDRPYSINFNGKPSGLCILKRDIVGVHEVAEDS